MVGSLRLRAADYVLVARGEHADVRLSPRAKEEFDLLVVASHSLGHKQHQQLVRFMDRFCDSPRPRMTPEQYKKEGEFPDGLGGTVAVYEFKPFKWRLYGAILRVDGRKCFVGTRVDPQKKQNKADRAALEQTALDVGKLVEYGRA